MHALRVLTEKWDWRNATNVIDEAIQANLVLQVQAVLKAVYSRRYGTQFLPKISQVEHDCQCDSGSSYPETPMDFLEFQPESQNFILGLAAIMFVSWPCQVHRGSPP